MEYNRKVTPMVGEGPGRPGDERTMSFGTVTINEGSGADQKVRAGCWVRSGWSESVVRAAVEQVASKLV
jgi:hypothetical protein